MIEKFKHCNSHRFFIVKNYTMKVKSSLLRVRKLNALKDGTHCTRYPSKIFFAVYNACPWIEPIFTTATWWAASVAEVERK